MTSDKVAKVENGQSLAPMRPAEVVAQVKLIQEMMSDVMHDGEHYGTIPGTPKPTLYKAGAEKLSLLFRIAPDYDTTIEDLGNGHREYRVKCILTSLQSGKFLGSGVGSCSTMESKYRYRNAAIKCPACGKEAVIKGKKEYGGGWLCYGKKGGCGEKWKDGDPIIEDQEQGKVENPDIADVYNTCWKMAKKRSFVDAMLTVTAASDLLTQDVEDLPDYPMDPGPMTGHESVHEVPEQREDPPRGKVEDGKDNDDVGKKKADAAPPKAAGNANGKGSEEAPPKDTSVHEQMKAAVLARRKYGWGIGKIEAKWGKPFSDMTIEELQSLGTTMKTFGTDKGKVDAFLDSAPFEPEVVDVEPEDDEDLTPQVKDADDPNVPAAEAEFEKDSVIHEIDQFLKKGVDKGFTLEEMGMPPQAEWNKMKGGLPLSELVTLRDDLSEYLG